MTTKQTQEYLPALVAAYDVQHGSGSFDRALASIQTLDQGLRLLDDVLCLKNSQGIKFIITASLQFIDLQKRAMAHNAIQTITDRIRALPDATHCQTIEQVYKNWSHETLQDAYAIFEVSRRIYQSTRKSAQLPPSEAVIRAAKWNLRMVSTLCLYSSSLKPGDRILERAALAYAFAQKVEDPEGSQERQMIANIARCQLFSQQKPNQSLVASNGLIGPRTGTDSATFKWYRTKRDTGKGGTQSTNKGTAVASVQKRHIPPISGWRGKRAQSVE